jgi:hypothetical protein
VTADNQIDGELDTQGWNRFAYVKNNPIMYKDPTGHKVELIVVPTRKDKGVHTFLKITPDNPEDFISKLYNDIKKKEDRITDKNIDQMKNKQFSFTISGFGQNKKGEDAAFNSNLVAEANWKGDQGNKKILKSIEIKPKDGMSDTDFIKEIVSNFRKYRDVPYEKKYEYELLPDLGEREFNCNSTSHGLLKSSGAKNVPTRGEIQKDLSLKYIAPGWERPIDFKNLENNETRVKQEQEMLRQSR